MALSNEQHKQLLSASLPAANQVRRELQDYLARTGLTTNDFSRRIGYAHITLNLFMCGRYQSVAGTDAAIRRAITEFIAAHPAGGFEDVSGKLYETENVKLLRRYFTEALNRGLAYYVEGDPGTQKSFVLQRLVAELNARELMRNGHGRKAYYIYCSQGIRPTQLLKSVAEACGSLAVGDTRRIIRNLRFDFRSHRVLLIFDEAQHLDVPCLETVRELHDMPPHFGLLFAGSHQLERMFRTHALQLEQWNSRFHAGKRLPGISEEEAAGIIRGEMGQAKDAAVQKLINAARATALASGGEHQYISARRLFNTLRELKEAGEQSA